MKNSVESCCVLIILALSACSKSQSMPQPTGCVADSLRELHGKNADIAICKGNLMQCRDRCVEGDALSCLGAAHAMQEMKGSEAVFTDLYHQACVGGVANGCTNYAASIWAHEPSPKELICARKIFDKACVARDHFACGMLGRIDFESESAGTRQAAKERLETDCKAMGGFPCRVLALHMERGDFGSYDKGRLELLLRNACDGKDDDACGKHSTVAETFRSAD